MSKLPAHVAIIMDGNGRWAQKRHMPRIAGHKAGAKRVREVIRFCGEKKIPVLTLFAFSNENWQRSTDEVSGLMELFFKALKKDVPQLHKNQVRFRMLGDRQRLSATLQQEILEAEKLTQDNQGLHLNIAVSYSGRWDIEHAVQQIAIKIEQQHVNASEVDAKLLASQLATADLPDPDFLIRTSGEQRISNFMLWQLAYTELYFTKILWPDFDQNAFESALADYSQRERRYGGVAN